MTAFLVSQGKSKSISMRPFPCLFLLFLLLCCSICDASVVRGSIASFSGSPKSTERHLLSAEPKCMKSVQTHQNSNGIKAHMTTNAQERHFLAYTQFQKNLFWKRDDSTDCDANRTCIDGSCCSKFGHCGYGDEFCGKGCQSNCNATAQCGVNSPGGKVSCALNTCCSHYGYCGSTESFCTVVGKGDNSTGCQVGFGSCNVTAPSKCDISKKSASKGRNLAYYQFGNDEYRLCNRINISTINTTDLTQLNLAFAQFDPSKNFAVGPKDASQLAGYKKFTALKTKKLQTWIAIGGWDFSNPNTSTANAWSYMVGSKANRTAFIASCQKFMKDVGFQGVDLDWEYPVVPARGGRPNDTMNFVELVKEMRQAWKTSYGISITVPLDFGTLQYFDLKAMEPYLDTIGIMSYDLQYGPTVKFQTDMQTIIPALAPVWSSGVNPAKLNFGLAAYGRGYTLAEKNCTKPECNYSGLSKPGPCTNEAGTMSFTEIQNEIVKYRPNITLVQDSMTKYVSWDDQWIGYDDDQTFDMKKAWADEHCFGGTMTWSVDFKTGQGY